MLPRETIVRLDKAHVWHPYTAMDAWADEDPIVVERAEGAYLWDRDGTRYLDGNASWYTATLGHGHPRLRTVLREQAEALAHCALAGIAHEPAAALAADLARITGMPRVFYTDNGSTAIEAAVKIAIQAWRQRGAEKKTRFVALDGAFHGDSIGAASLGGVEVFRRPFSGVLFDCVRAPFPDDDAHARAFDAIAATIRREKDTIAAVVVEPIVQCTAGMRIYSPAFLRELADLARKNDVLFIADEVFTGFGRTGTMWACEQADLVPDVMCIGKAFASFVPLGATLVTEEVFDAFRGAKDRAFMYGHTFCGNPLGTALAREVLAIYEEEAVVEGVGRLHERIASSFDRLGETRGVARVRSIGGIGAADLAGGRGYLGDLGWQVYREARKRGAYLRPLGDTIYVTPALNIADDDLDALLGILHESVRAVVSGAKTT